MLPRIPFKRVGKTPEQEAREFIALNKLNLNFDALSYRGKRIPPVPIDYISNVHPYKGTIRGYTLYKVDVINGNNFYRAVNMGKHLKAGRQFMWWVDNAYDVMHMMFINSPAIGDFSYLEDAILGATYQRPSELYALRGTMDAFAQETYKKKLI